MSTIDVLITARKLADEAGVEWRDLDELLPEQQLAGIRDRIARSVIAKRLELLGLTERLGSQRVAGHRIAA